MSHIPPECPNCGDQLTEVWEQEEGNWKFDEDTGTYFRDPLVGNTRCYCVRCGYEVLDLFEEGVCNYKNEPTCEP